MNSIVNYVGKVIRNNEVVSFITNNDGQVPQNVVNKCQSILKQAGQDVELIGGKVEVEGKRVMLRLFSKEKFIPKMVIVGGAR